MIFKSLTEEQFKELKIEVREYIAKDLNNKILLVIEHKLNEWFMTNLELRFDSIIRDELNKLLVVKLGAK